MPIWPREKTAVAEAISLAPASWRIPFWSVEPLVCALDCFIIVGSSVVSGFAYHQWALGGGGDFATALAVVVSIPTVSSAQPEKGSHARPRFHLHRNAAAQSEESA